MAAPDPVGGAEPPAGGPLLDRGTQLVHHHGSPRFRAVIWPTCGEATLQEIHPPPETLNPSSLTPEERALRNRQRAIGRAKTTARRYCLHNGLGRMLTLTHAEEASDVDDLGNDVYNFRKRLLRQHWFTPEAFPYLWVAERGKRRQRLHAHLAVGRWYDDLGCVEVCERCATDGLRRKRKDIPPVGSRCIGCVWGHGFVGRPFDGESNPTLAAHYCTKYLAKSMGDGLPGRQAYRVAEGFQPEPVRLVDLTWEEAERLVPDLLGVDLERTEAFALHDHVEGWAAAPTWTITITRERADDAS